LINARNQAEQVVYGVEKLLKEHESKLTEADRSAIRAAADRVKEVSKGEDAAAIQQAVENLQQASHAMAQRMYSQAGQAPTGAGSGRGGAAPAGKDEDVQDAEFEVKK